MEVVFCVVRGKELFAIYGTAEKAESVASQMTEKHNESYRVETRAIL